MGKPLSTGDWNGFKNNEEAKSFFELNQDTLVVPSEVRGLRCLPAGTILAQAAVARGYAPRLLNLNHAGALAGFDLSHTRGYPSRKFEDRLGVRRVLAFEHDRLAAVAGFAYFGIERNVSEK